MTLLDVALLCGLAFVYAAIVPARYRGWALFVFSVIAVFWFQPPLVIRQLDFFLPVLTLFIAAGTWAMTARHATRSDRVAFILLLGIVTALSLTRYLVPALWLTGTRPPATPNVVVYLGLGAITGWLMWQIRQYRMVASAGILVLLLLFVVLKSEPLAAFAAAGLRALSGQDPQLAGALDIRWLGFSYIAFRLIHTLRDHQFGILPDMRLHEFVTYALFFPALTAGPIDRAERFTPQFRNLIHIPGLDSERFLEGFQRIGAGLFKKFVIADSLALVALDPQNALQAQTALGLWVLLYAYAFRLYFDFSGYTDIAIGIGILFGIRLPENFQAPYLKPNIAAFWQSWHITLSDWARTYVFSPVSRGLLRRRVKPTRAMFAAHLGTMIVIGLWHGISGSFLVWGIWHGLGLFTYSQWTQRTRRWHTQQSPRTQQALRLAGIALTFHFVVLGWVWFVIPDLSTATSVFVRLFTP